MAKSEPNASGIQLMPMELKEKPTPFKKKGPLAVYASMPQAIHEYMPFDEIILSQVRQQRTPFFFFYCECLD
jgi:hypothetical protein